MSLLIWWASDQPAEQIPSGRHQVHFLLRARSGLSWSAGTRARPGSWGVSGSTLFGLLFGVTSVFWSRISGFLSCCPDRRTA
jgi:hypothetical protein